MTIKPIRSDADLHAVFRHLESIYQAGEGTPQADERDVWVTLIEAYENKHYAFGPADPVEAIKLRMEQQGLSAVIPQIHVEPELRAELEAGLRHGETLTDFVEATVRNAIAFRRVQTSFHARAQAASEAYHQTGVSVPVEAVLKRLQSKLDAKRKKLGR